MSCFLSGQHTYSHGSLRDVLLGGFRTGGRHPFAELWRGASQVGVLGSGVREERDSVRLDEVMVPQGFGSGLRLALACGGLPWGTKARVRERGQPCFTDAEVVHAQCAVAPPTQALRRFVARRTPRPLRSARPPAVVGVDGTERIRAATPEGRAWLRACLPGFTGGRGWGGRRCWQGPLHPRRPRPGRPAADHVHARHDHGPLPPRPDGDRIPTPDGWIESVSGPGRNSWPLSRTESLPDGPHASLDADTPTNACGPSAL
ncbi:hypothetical protein [Streptomyces alboflavus]|uniref:hypothetical protein n=1 Tax=Streptomyces alboflavus TaxID=67267 RepID=UPI0037BBBD70